MTHYMRDGVRYQIAPSGALDITELLPLGTYKVGYMEPFDRYFLEKMDDFSSVAKVYGNAIAQRDRILRTFEDREVSTGVMLSGEKGSGKTLLAKLISLQAQEKGVPTIVINQPWHGDTFNSFMQSIDQSTVVVFDEFEKVYDQSDQEKLLTLLDGTFTTKKLFILTTNDKYKVNTHMRNRPGRIFYRLDFGGLAADFIREYAGDTLENTERVDEVVRVAMLFSRFNFDILKALVEEMNRYDESAEQALEMLNAKPELGERHRYVVSLTVGGKRVPITQMHNRGAWTGNPLTEDVSVYYNAIVPEPTVAPVSAALTEVMAAPNPWDDDDDDGTGGRTRLARFATADLRRVDVQTGDFNFVNAEGIEATLTESFSTSVDYSVVY